MGGLPL